ncbi:FAD-dependent oxidoreductase [Nocardioides sp. LHD-245]|uniref:NAD(P)/FAD-dependent oxidoreductase n=1 Tax=Nocardioides sp. LHD-245 TaxID=3051387 RepID=UPI0027E0D3E6|nr:FAD-dependent oxidoreductase [Nocardioides sp. LHD-245]
MSLSQSPDVVVVGAGAVGTSCAYHLAAAGLKVMVVEQDRVAAGSSTCATGAMYSISADFDDAEYLRWGVRGHHSTKAIVPVLEDLSGVRTGYQCRPAMRLAIDDEEERQVRADLEWQSEVMSVRWLDPDDVRAIEPSITRDVRGAAFEPEALQVPADRLSHAFMRSAERFGAALFPTTITGLARRGDRVVGVTHKQGTIACDNVVLAMGASAALASEWTGYTVPVRPLRGERLMLRWPSQPLQAILSTPRRGHLISRVDGFLSIGSTGGRDFDDRENWIVDQNEAVADPHPPPSPEAREELLRQATEVLPTVKFATVGQHITGIRPLSRDTRPLVGAVPGLRGAYLATGHTHRGIHLAAATGELVRDLLVHGGSLQPSCDPALFDPARFL